MSLISFDTQIGIQHLQPYWEMTRPPTQWLPVLCVVCAALTSLIVHTSTLKSGVDQTFFAWDYLGQFGFNLIWACIASAAVNAYSNAINQVYDQVEDAINKPDRPLVTARADRDIAFWIIALLALIALVSAALVNVVFFILVALAGLITTAYSVPPIRTKRHAWLAQFTIAFPRGFLVFLAGWSCVEDASLNSQSLYLGTIIFLFLLGASGAKDLADVEGDRLAGCRTLPVRYGIRDSTWIIAPFFVLPWIMLPLGALLYANGTPVLQAGFTELFVAAVAMMTYGSWVVYIMLAIPEERWADNNHPAWAHMYLMTIVANLAYVLVYTVSFARGVL